MDVKINFNKEVEVIELIRKNSKTKIAESFMVDSIRVVPFFNENNIMKYLKDVKNYINRNYKEKWSPFFIYSCYRVGLMKDGGLVVTFDAESLKTIEEKSIDEYPEKLAKEILEYMEKKQEQTYNKINNGYKAKENVIIRNCDDSALFLVNFEGRNIRMNKNGVDIKKEELDRLDELIWEDRKNCKEV